MDNSEFTSPKKKQPISRVLFAEVGALELGAVVVALFLLFGVLNYFRLINLSAALPFLSFLPRQTIAATAPANTTKTFVSRVTIYLGKVTSINGIKLTIVNRGSTITITSDSKTLFNTIPPSLSSPRTFIPGQDVRVGNNVQVVITQAAGKNPVVSTVYKLDQSTFNMINRSIP